MNAISFTPFPGMTTERLTLRRLGLEDENEVFILKSDEGVLEYLDRPKAVTIDEARELIDKIKGRIARDEWIHWAIAPKGERRLIGAVCLWNVSREDSKAEIGYELCPTTRGKG